MRGRAAPRREARAARRRLAALHLLPLAANLACHLWVDWLFALGGEASAVARGARDAGMPGERVVASTSFEELCARLLEVAARGDWILVKGSRAMRMERIASELEKQERC